MIIDAFYMMDIMNILFHLLSEFMILHRKQQGTGSRFDFRIGMRFHGKVKQDLFSRLVYHFRGLQRVRTVGQNRKSNRRINAQEFSYRCQITTDIINDNGDFLFCGRNELRGCWFFLQIRASINPVSRAL